MPEPSLLGRIGDKMLDNIETQVFSRIKYGFSERVRKAYPDLNFTTSDRASTEPKFPTVYVHLMQSLEIGSTLEGTDLVAMNASFQIEVTDNQSSARADEVSREVLRIMKVMRFRASGMPFRDNTGDTYRTVARYQRVIADGDVL